MTTQDLTQLGIGGVSIGAIVMIVKCFIEFISLQEKNFNKILGNHIKHSTKAFQNNEKTTLKLVNAIDKLTDKLDK